MTPRIPKTPRTPRTPEEIIQELLSYYYSGFLEPTKINLLEYATLIEKLNRNPNMKIKVETNTETNEPKLSEVSTHWKPRAKFEEYADERIAKVYAQLRKAAANLGQLQVFDKEVLTEKELKRLDRATVLLQISYKIVKRIGRKRNIDLTLGNLFGINDEMD